MALWTDGYLLTCVKQKPLKPFSICNFQKQESFPYSLAGRGGEHGPCLCWAESADIRTSLDEEYTSFQMWNQWLRFPSLSYCVG